MKTELEKCISRLKTHEITQIIKTMAGAIGECPHENEARVGTGCNEYHAAIKEKKCSDMGEKGEKGALCWIKYAKTPWNCNPTIEGCCHDEIHEEEPQNLGVSNADFINVGDVNNFQ